MKKATVTVEPGKQEVFITREFDAPRELVFKAYTAAELYAQWIGPKGYKTKLEKFEAKSGGEWAYTTTDLEGNDWKFCGVNHLVIENEMIVGTFEFLGMPERGHVALETCKFEDLPGGRSRVVGQSVFQSVEDRDGMVQSGMEIGVQEGFEQLDGILESMKNENY